MSEKKPVENTPTKVEQASAMFQELKVQGLKPKEIYAQIAQELEISVRSARSYVWRVQNPEKYKAVLERYFAKRKVREATAKKAKAKKKKPKKPAEAEETEEAPAEEPEAAESTTREKNVEK